MKTYEGYYGYTYYMSDEVLMAVPTGEAVGDEMSEIEVDEFAEPLTKTQYAHVLRELGVNNLDSKINGMFTSEGI